MSDRKFIQRLTQELPQQVKRGTEPDTLSYVESRQPSNERIGDRILTDGCSARHCIPDLIETIPLLRGI